MLHCDKQIIKRNFLKSKLMLHSIVTCDIKKRSNKMLAISISNITLRCIQLHKKITKVNMNSS